MTSAKLPEARIPDTHVGILDTALLATVSTISHKDGLISTNPVAFDWDGEYLRLSTLKSRVKYRNLLANPQPRSARLIRRWERATWRSAGTRK
jgi:hypothetical protein